MVMKNLKVLVLLCPLFLIFVVSSCQNSIPTADLEISNQSAGQEYEKVDINPGPALKATICTDCCQGYAPLCVRFNVSKCSGNITSYTWISMEQNLYRTDKDFKHTFTEPGVYIVTLTVRDNQNRIARDMIKIRVLDRSIPPKQNNWLP
jgi:hypothetical protein